MFDASVHTEDDVFQDGRNVFQDRRMHFFDIRHKSFILWLGGVTVSLYHHGVSGGVHNHFGFPSGYFLPVV